MGSREFLKSMDREPLKIVIKEAVNELLSERHLESNSDTMLTVKQASVLLNSAVSTIYEKTSTRNIPHYKRKHPVNYILFGNNSSRLLTGCSGILVSTPLNHSKGLI